MTWRLGIHGDGAAPRLGRWGADWIPAYAGMTVIIGGAVAGRSTLDEGCRFHSVRLRVHAQLRLPPDLPSVTLGRERMRKEQLLRLPPDLPSVTLSERVRLALRVGCGCPPISHRLHCVRLRTNKIHVAVAPRSPIGYTVCACGRTRFMLRLPPDLPSVTLLRPAQSRHSLVAVAPRSPIGYTTTSSPKSSFSSCGCPPISHRLHSHPVTSSGLISCGCPPISHRLHWRRSNPRSEE